MAVNLYVNGKLRWVGGRSKQKTRFCLIFPVAVGALFLSLFQLIWFVYDVMTITLSEDGWTPTWDLMAYMFTELHKLNAGICLMIAAVCPPHVLCCPRLMKPSNESVIIATPPESEHTTYQEFKALKRESKKLLKEEAIKRARSVPEALITIANVSLLVVYIGYCTMVLFHMVMWAAGFVGLTVDEEPWQPTKQEWIQIWVNTAFFMVYNWWQAVSIPATLTSLAFIKRTGLSGWTYESAVAKEKQIKKDHVRNHEGWQMLSAMQREANLVESAMKSTAFVSLQRNSREESIGGGGILNNRRRSILDAYDILGDDKRTKHGLLNMNHQNQKGGWEEKLREDNQRKKKEKAEEKELKKEAKRSRTYHQTYGGRRKRFKRKEKGRLKDADGDPLIANEERISEE